MSSPDRESFIALLKVSSSPVDKARMGIVRKVKGSEAAEAISERGGMAPGVKGVAHPGAILLRLRVSRFTPCSTARRLACHKRQAKANHAIFSKCVIWTESGW